MHVAVIGAGVGGLTAAIQLALDGHRVSLFDSHDEPGGKIHQVSVGGQAMDAGPTVFTLRRVFDELYERAGLSFEDEVGLEAADRLARHAWIGSETLDLFADVEKSCAAIEQFAGSTEAAGYRRFAQRTAEIFTTLDDTFMRAPLPTPLSLTVAAAPRGLARLWQTAPVNSLWQALGRDFKDQRLRQLFGRYATYCGSSPFQAPSTLALIAHAERAGVWTLQGGMQTLARSLTKLAVTVGCEIHVNRTVSRIRTQAGRTSGIELDDDRKIDADAVVYNGDVQALTAGLLGHDVKNAVKPRRRNALSAVTRCEYAQVTGFTLAHHTVLFSNDYPAEFNALFKRQCVPAKPTVYLCAQDRRPPRDGLDVAVPERVFCLINAPARDLSAAELEDAERALDNMLNAHGLTFERAATPAVTQPADFAERFPASCGALYGRPTHGFFGSFQRPGSSCRVAGLYLAGGTVHPGAGVPMAAMSGVLAAERINRDATSLD